MTGEEVANIRDRMGLDPFAFAAVLGVSVSTIYRWEATPVPEINPLQRDILAGLYAKKLGKRDGADLGDAVRKGLIAGGTLAGLRVVLNFLEGDKPHG